MVGRVEQKNAQRSLSISNDHTSAQRSSFGMSRVGASNTKDWLGEIMEFTAIVSRRMQYTLSRIQLDFMKNERNMAFDEDFRDHFLYIVNNRLVEAFDAFLLQMPRARRSNCPINKNKYTTPLDVPSIEPAQPSKIAKRKRPNSYRPSIEPEQPAICAAKKQRRPNANTRASTMAVVTSESTQSSSSSTRIVKRPDIGVQVEVSQVTTSSTSLAVMNTNNKKVTSRKEVQTQQRRIALNKFPIVLIPRLQVPDAMVEQSTSLKSIEPAMDKEATAEAAAETNGNCKENMAPRMVGTDVVPKKVEGRRTAIDEHSLSLQGSKVQPRDSVIVSSATNKRATKRKSDHKATLDHSHGKPKDREKQPDVTKDTSIASRQSNAMDSSNAAAGTAMVSSRRSRPKMTYECDGCSYFSEVKANYDRHLLLHKQCMAVTIKKGKHIKPLKMIAN